MKRSAMLLLALLLVITIALQCPRATGPPPTSQPSPAETALPTLTNTPEPSSTATRTFYKTNTPRPTGTPTIHPQLTATAQPKRATVTPARLPTPTIATSGGTIYIGSKNSDKFHYLSCTYAKKIKPANAIYFYSREAALAAGYVPCAVCRP